MTLEQNIRRLAPGGLRLNLWPTSRGYQANVSEQGGNGWTVFTAEDPVFAVQEALRQRIGGVASRTVEHHPEPQQIDLEEAIAAAEAKAPGRVLIYHPESDSLFEAEHFETDGLAEDVTGNPVYEQRWAAMQQQAAGLEALLG